MNTGGLREPVPGGPLRRVVARVIDAAVLGVLAYWPGTRGPRLPEVVVGYVGFMFRLGVRTDTLAGIDRMVLARWSGALGALLGALVYFTLCEGRGQTLGKRMVGVRVVREDGDRLVGRAQALGRSLAAVLTSIPLGIGPLAMFWDPKRRTWADLMAGTRVVRVGWAGQVDSLARPVITTLVVTLALSVAVPFVVLLAPLSAILDL